MKYEEVEEKVFLVEEESLVDEADQLLAIFNAISKSTRFKSKS